jgi:hypothetical protein
MPKPKLGNAPFLQAFWVNLDKNVTKTVIKSPRREFLEILDRNALRVNFFHASVLWIDVTD